MRITFKQNPFFGVIIVLFLSLFIFTNRANAQKEKTLDLKSQESSKGARIVILTSGPAEFSSHWLDDPPRLFVEFQSKNIVTKIDKEIVVEEGVIKRITPTYFGRGRSKTLKTLTFELSEKVGSNIWQEGDAIILDIQGPSKEESIVLERDIGKNKILEESEEEIIERLEVMDTMLTEVAGTVPPLETPKAEAAETLKEAEQKETTIETVPPKTETPPPIVVPEALSGTPETVVSVEKKATWSWWALWIVGLILASGSGFLIWYKKRKLDIDERIKRLKLELEEKTNQLKHIAALCKAVEKASLEKNGEFKKLELELQEKNDQLHREKTIREKLELAISEKDEKFKKLKLELSENKNKLGRAKTEYELVQKRVSEKDDELKRLEIELQKKNNRLKDVKGIVPSEEKIFSPPKKEKIQSTTKSDDKRSVPRLSLTKDFNKTIILGVESLKKPRLRCFANNISSGGLCFESEREFNKSQPINLRLFFYGDKVPMIKTQARVVWKKTEGQISYYGVSFNRLDEKDKSELVHYIESNLTEKATVEA